jgi:twitching motility protein PilU
VSGDGVATAPFEELLREVVARDGTDLFLTVGLAPTLQAKGRYLPIGDARPMDAPGVAALVRAALPPSELASWDRGGDANAAYALAGSDRFRVNAFRQRGDPGMVIRRIRTTITPLAELGVPSVLERVAVQRQGLVLVTGATGSGKSTTLAAMIDHRNGAAPGHIVTLEDPIEFVHPHRQCLVTQREVGFDTDSFALGLKNALRQAPNVLLIGEIRDRETAEAALHFADTGHLVLSTLHATNANQTLERLIHMFPHDAERGLLHQLSLNLKAIVSQRLLPRADGQGRVLAMEVMIATPRVAALVKEGRVEELKEAMTQGAGDGCQTFDSNLFALYREGKISGETACAYADSGNDMRLRIRLESGAREQRSEIKIVG